MSHAYAKARPGSSLPAHGGYFHGLNKDSYVRPGWEAVCIGGIRMCYY